LEGGRPLPPEYGDGARRPPWNRSKCAILFPARGGSAFGRKFPSLGGVARLQRYA